MNKRLYFFFLFILTLSIIPPPLTSQEEEKSPPPIKNPSFTEEIVVTGEIVAETATVSTITQDQIHYTGAKNVAEAIEYISGVYIRVGGSGSAYVRARGFRQREMALLIDGIPVSSPYDGQLDLSSLPTDIIDRIEVIKGASSLMYGSNAMGGVINIITKKSSGARSISLRGDYGSGKTAEMGVAFQGIWGKTRYLISSSYFDQQNYSLSNDYQPKPNQEAGNRANSDRRLWNGKISLGWDIGKHGRTAINFHHIDQSRGLPHHESDRKAKF